MKNIKSIFDHHCQTLKIDDALARQIHLYVASFISKNEDHVKFFGGNLLGVQTVRYTTADKNEWVDGLLHLDETEIREQVIQLPTIDPNWIRATNIVNLSCCYLVHRFFNSTMSQEKKRQAMIDTLMAMQIRLLTSLLFRYFPYPANEKTALATYAALSKKFLIKKKGNWYDALIQRCEDIIDPQKSIHKQTITKFDDDAAIIYMVHDIQNRLKEIVKKIWRVFDVVHTQGAKILSVGGTIELDGKMIVKDVSRIYTPYRRYMDEIIRDKARFVKPQLVNLIGSYHETMSEELLTKTLYYISEETNKNNKKIEVFVDNTLQHTFNYLSTDEKAVQRMGDPGSLIMKFKGLYMSSRSSDPLLMEMRKQGSDIVEKATGNKSENVVSAVKTGLCLYIVLRAFTKNFYG